MSRRRVFAITLKELRTYRRTTSIVATMAVIPFVFIVQPLVSIFADASAASAMLRSHHELIYMLGIPALVPALLASYSIVGERQQATLEPVLTTPIRAQELVLGKALAVLAPAVVVSYVIFGVFAVLVALFAHAGIASALLRPSDLIAQLVFTPLIATWSVWVAIAISTRSSDVRVAQQLSTLASLPAVAVTTLIAVDVIHSSRGLAIALALGLLVVDRLGWRAVSALFQRERLITGG